MTKLLMSLGSNISETWIDLSKLDLTSLRFLSPVVSETQAKYGSEGSIFSSSVTFGGTAIAYSDFDATYTSGTFTKLKLVSGTGLGDVVATFTDLNFNADDVNLLLTSKSAGLARLLAGNDVMYGGNGDDVLLGLAGRDELYGRDGNDKIYGGAGSDKLYGRHGNDYIDGGASADIMDGGDGNDRYVIDDRRDKVLEKKTPVYSSDPSFDTILSSTISIDLAKFANVEKATLTGDRALRLWGSAQKDVLEGNAGNNAIYGRAGNDAMRGNDGADTIHGGAGQDVLTGGPGDDVFVYKNWRESVRLERDTIKDFKPDEDLIDLRGIDANTLTAGNSVFRFLTAKSTEFSGQAGELRWRHQGNTTIIEGDVNGDRTADLVIHLNGKIVLSSGDFVL